MLIVQHLLLGDTIMLTPLIKKARQRYPDAEIVMTCPRAYASIYEGRPYGVRVLPFDSRSLADHRALRKHRGFDLAVVPGDNRWAWLARALDARWVVAFAPDQPSYRDWPIDEMRSMPKEPMAWGDMAAGLLDGADAKPYSPSEWRSPKFEPYGAPRQRYCVFHLGAGNPNRLWPPERWAAVLNWAENRGYEVVLTTGPGEESLAAKVDPDGSRRRLAGQLNLAQLWDLLRGASFLVCPDTGIAHLARVVGVPTAAIYGPGSPISTGPGRFWADSPFVALWDPDVHCRDQNDFFGRRLQWLRQCARTVAECSDPFCMRRTSVTHVIDAVEKLSKTAPRA